MGSLSVGISYRNSFLNNKDLLDKASCKIIRVNDQGLALEIFHRLLNKEDNFEMLSILYGQGPEI